MRNCSKSLCIAERKQAHGSAHGRFKIVDVRFKPHKVPKPLWYQIDPDDSSMLILRDDTRIKQKQGLDLFLSLRGDVYSLTKYGLRRLRVNYTRKRRYGMLSCNGVRNGRRYPYITFRGGTYAIHILMVEIWMRPRREGEEVDHLDGNIDNFALNNLELVTVAENNRRRKILNAMRRVAAELNDPSLDPINKTPEEMARIYHDITVDEPAKIMEWEMRHHMEV